MKEHFNNSNFVSNEATNDVFFNGAVNNEYRLKKLMFANHLDKFRESLKPGFNVHNCFCELTELLFSLLELFESKTNIEMWRHSNADA